jgi:hypothetical protein
VKAKDAGETKLQLHHEMTAKHGTWFVIRARGKLPQHKPKYPFAGFDSNQESAKLAFSGAVYVYVDGQSFWKPSIVPSIVQNWQQDMERLMPEAGEAEESLSETTLLLWDSQKGLLKQRIDQVMATYDRLVSQARMAE